MFIRPQMLTAFVALAIATSVSQVSGQVVFSDTDFSASDYDVFNAGTDGLEDVRFSFDYGSFDIFGDSFITGSIPEAPNSNGGAATTGVFVSVNNDGLNPAVGTEPMFAAVFPKLSNLNSGAGVGTGTPTPHYKVSLDVFGSTSAGVIDTVNGVEGDGDDATIQNGTTNKVHIGINHANPADVAFEAVSINLTDGTGTGSTPSGTQGMGLGFSPDTGASEDFIPVYGGFQYALRAGRPRSIFDGTASTTGRSADFIQEFWRDAGLGLTIDDYDETLGPTSTQLSKFTGDPQGHFAPDPNDIAGFDATDSATGLNFYAETFPTNTAPLHYDVSSEDLVTALGIGENSRLRTNEEAGDVGTPYNQWSEHEIIFSDEIMTYSINGTIIVQMAVADVEDAVSTAGTVMLAYYDRFSSLANSPEGANFVIYDNLVIETAASGDTPDIMANLQAAGFLPSASNPADADGDGDVDGADFLFLQRNNPAGISDWLAAYPAPASSLAAGSVPEPSTAVLMIGLAVGLVSRRSR